MSDRSRQSHPVPDHVGDLLDHVVTVDGVLDHVERANNELSDERDWLWTNMLSGDDPEYIGATSAVVCPALHAFCEAFEQRERKANEAEEAATARQGGLPPGESLNMALQPPHDAALHAMGPTNNDAEEVTADTITLNKFWWLLLARKRYWHRQEETPVNTFVKAWQLLERRQQMAEAGMAEMYWLVELLLQEEFADIFPTNFAPEHWYQLLQADFQEEDCKILFLLDFDRGRHLDPLQA
ncbi:hypothetical protein E4U15_002374 [Claviceps sp. LM218 group G6]|nr:hypothetical protein E4U15_002374 [Claviceps sp. LM218 group G6]